MLSRLGWVGYILFMTAANKYRATLVIVSSLRNVISFGMNFGVFPFIDARGYFGTFTIFAGLIIFFGLWAIPMAIWGKRMRHFTERWARKPNSTEARF
jgi:hypothetical protein